MSTMTPTTTRLRDYRMLWRAAVTHAHPRLSAITRWGTIVALIVFGAATAVKEGPRAGLAMLWCGASVMLLLHWAWRFMPGAVKLASPANAWLVPHMRQRLVELSCLVCCIGLAGIASAPYADAGALGGWLFWIALFIAGSGLAAAGHPAGTALIFALSIGVVWVGKLPAGLEATLSHPLAVLLALPVYACLIFVAVGAMFPQGGERHWTMLARRMRWAAMAGKSAPLDERLAGVHTKGWYAATLRRDSARRHARGLALHALGPTHHLGETALPLAVIAGIVVALGLFTSWRVDPTIAPNIGWLFACMLLTVPLLYCARLGELPAQLGAEQSLVRLAPSTPAGAGQFNVWLGRSLLLQALKAWSLAAGAALLLAALGGAGPEALLRVAGIAGLVLPIVAAPLRNHAGRTGSAAAAAATLMLVSTVESLVAGALVHEFTDLPLLPVAGLVGIGFTVFVTVRRLRAMERAPCAFPAGRTD